MATFTLKYLKSSEIPTRDLDFLYGLVYVRVLEVDGCVVQVQADPTDLFEAVNLLNHEKGLRKLAWTIKEQDGQPFVK